ncbi:glycoside hydrolase family 32 protein [Aureliella helgolandensis]|uniref:Levanase n=1 Tax=Aureliella helgolandensis TaxID=2527968 RepID=A0A518G725_9BACT|nr:glycoside hydrolase family 32 protein [Aureliella helgolandensis]QDV24371.1 Levanase precursor [Aureliella helgolandensis]
MRTLDALSRRLSLGVAVCGLLFWLLPLREVAADDVLIEDFEAESYGEWTITGDAFGPQPAKGTHPNQQAVVGFRGTGLVNTFRAGDPSIGSATSPEFEISRKYVGMLIGGGARIEETAVELLVEGTVVRKMAGDDSEELEWKNWDVSPWLGKQAQIRIVDQGTGSWGHLNVDHLIQSDKRPTRFDLEYRLSEYRKSTDYLAEPLRPQVHFSPEIHWMNDPNGLVFHQGEYHLFYQYNPAGNTWGHMSWGHAVSPDLVHWEHLPLAIPEEDGVMIFSGCCVVDHDNTAGLGTKDDPAMVAVYTGHGHGKQVQNLAYSTDRGRTWTKYAGNPVLDINSSAFRDPKVFWHAPSQEWKMVVSLADEKVLVFYGSSDLLQWNELSRFGPAGVVSKSNWECPDLFELPVENGSEETLWVLEADMGSGAIAGGSGGEYFVGKYDGVRFSPIQDSQWVDHGRDFYAPVSWSDLPEEDGRRIWIGWFNNWETCLVPTFPWRSCMSIPRELSLRRIPTAADASQSAVVLVQRPVRELEALRQGGEQIDTSAIGWPPQSVTTQGQIAELSFDLEMTLEPGESRSCGVRIRTGEGEFIEVGYDREPGVVYVDRTHSGNVDFHPGFAGRHAAPTRLQDGTVTLRVVVDRSTIEVFINDGEAVISDRVFPTSQQAVLEVFGGGPTAKISKMQLWPLKSIWMDRD